MQVSCTNCNAKQWIDTENKDFDQDQDRCHNCGCVGTLVCLHSNTGDEGCLDCNATAEDIATEEALKEADQDQV